MNFKPCCVLSFKACCVRRITSSLSSSPKFRTLLLKDFCTSCLTGAFDEAKGSHFEFSTGLLTEEDLKQSNSCVHNIKKTKKDRFYKNGRLEKEFNRKRLEKELNRYKTKTKKLTLKNIIYSSHSAK